MSCLFLKGELTKISECGLKMRVGNQKKKKKQILRERERRREGVQVVKGRNREGDWENGCGQNGAGVQERTRNFYDAG